MFKKVNWRSTLISASVAAMLFCVPAGIYIYKASYPASWLLYLGGFLFFAVISIHTLIDNKKRGGNESTVAMIFASHVTTISGILIACCICFILLIIMVPGYLSPGITEKVLTDEPANMVSDKTDGLSFEIFMAAIIFNLSMGSFAGITFSFYSKRNQTRDSREPTPLTQSEAH